MKNPTSNPVGSSDNSRAWRGDRLVPLAALLILTIGFSTTWVAAGRDHPARVSFMDGRAAYESSGDVDWSEVTLNLPLVSGDRIVAHPDSRIEVELGDSNFVRVSGETDVFFAELSRKKTLLKIHQGDLILRVNDSGSVYLDMELAAMRIRKKGLYRIQADPDGTMRLVVHKGRVEVTSRHGKERVETGHELLLDASQVGIQALVRDLDDFELWSGRRDALLVSSKSTGYLGGVSYPGVHSLDHHGRWYNYGSHGHVWVPTVAVGWTPFRHGRWCYLAGGWTWVSYEPWGWLPYHYGRWIYYGPRARWAWVPGGFNRWHAAHVDFYWGNGYVGWAPRGYYGRGRRGGGNTTVVVNNNIFRNWNPRDRSNGLTVVHGRDLGRGPGRTRVVASNAIVGRFREGLPRELRRPRGRGPNAVYSGSGVRSSRLASRPTGRTRDRVAGAGSRRSGVARSGSKGSVVRVPSRPSAVRRSDRSGPTRSIVRQRPDSRRSGRSEVNVIRTPNRAPQTTRSTAPSRSLSRSSSGSGGSFTTRSNRRLSIPPVARPDSVSKGSRGRTPSGPTFVTRPNRTGSTGTFSRQRSDSRQRGRSGPSFSRTPNRTPQSSRPSSPSRSISRSSSGSRGSVTRRAPRNQSRPSVSRSRSTSQRSASRPAVRSSSRSSSRPSVQSRPAPRSTPSYRAPSPPRSRPSGSQVRSAPRSSGSSNRSSGSRRSSRRER